MSFSNLYTGSTITQLGGSYLGTRALVNIEEGYQFGSSIHYVNIGEFQVDTQTNKGVFNQRLDISAFSPIRRLYNNSFPIQKNVNSNFYWFDDFKNIETLSNYNYQSSNWGITLDNLRLGQPTESSVLFLQAEPVFDSRLITKFRMNDVTSTVPGFMIRASGTGEADVNGYLVQWNSFNNQFQAFKAIGGSFISITGSTGFTLSINTNYWTMLTAKDANITFHASTDGYNYTKLFDFIENTTKSGVPALRNGTGGSFTINFDSFDFVEITDSIDYAHVLDSTLRYAQIYGVSIYNNYAGFSQFSGGNSWQLGNSNNVFNITTSGGSMFKTFMTQGLSLNNFTAEVEVRGSSGTYFGIFAGVSYYWYGNMQRAVLTEGTTQYNTIVQYGSSSPFLSTATFKNIYTDRGNYAYTQPNTWYKMKMTKVGQFMGFYINDLLVNSVFGVSFPNTANPLLEGVDFGLLTYRNSTQGATVEFRNFSISSLSQFSSNIVYGINENLYSVFQRYLPEGYAVTYADNSVKIFPIGVSINITSLGRSLNLATVEDSIDNSAGYNSAILSTQTSVAKYVSMNDRITRNADSSKTDSINDQNAMGYGGAITLARQSNNRTSANINTSELSIVPRITMEQYDKINIVDSNTGISRNMTVYNVDKNLDFENGSFTQNISLGL